MNQWNNMDRVQPTKGQECEVIYRDGVQCFASFAGGQIFIMKDGSYRYVNVSMWRPVGGQS